MKGEPPGDSTRRDWVTLAAVLLLAVAVRGTILLTGQRCLRSDEAAVGLMAKHIVTRGERPVFLYGQPYGGGHAIVAYLTAPLFACFGRSAVLLTAVSAFASLVNVALLWAILRRYFSKEVALGGAALYAFSPPVVYQAFLVNGGTETFLLALIALIFFLKAYLDGKVTSLNGLATGLFSGLAYWGMDYALLYPAAFVLLWVTAGGLRQWRWLVALAAGFVVGCFPLLAYNLTHDFAHVRHMFGAGGDGIGFFAHFGGALWGMVSGDLAAFFGGDIDDFKSAGPGAWLHAAAAIAAVAALIYTERGAIREKLSSCPVSRERPSPLTARLLPVVFVAVYLAMYGAAKFSLPATRTPRYFLPLCPFVSIAIALVALSGRSVGRRVVGWAIIALLVAHGAALSLGIGMRPWHEEHRVRTSGREIERLAAFVRSRDIRLAFAPYEIQWRLMFATDESVVATCRIISPLERYEDYAREIAARAGKGDEPLAFIFRQDFAFAEWAAERRMGLVTRDSWRAAVAGAGLSLRGIPVGDEFVVFYPLTKEFLPHLVRSRAAKQEGVQAQVGSHP